MKGAPTRPDAARSQAQRVLGWSIGLALLLVASYAFVLVRVTQLKLTPDPRLRAAAGEVTSTRRELARRGDLCDRRGRVLASSRLGHRLFVDPQEVRDIYTVGLDLAKVLRRDPVDIDRAINTRLDRRYVVIDQLLADWEVAAVAKAGLEGVGLEPRLVREYPIEGVAAAVVGLVGFEHTGLGGFELMFDGALAPEHGSLTFLRDAKRRALWIEPSGYEPARSGADIHLSIDLVIQEVAERRLAEAVESFNAGGGRLVAMDCRSGEILAMCDVLRPREDWDEYTDDPIRDVHPALGRNRCVTDPYEPGSTFKPFVWSIATGLGHADPTEIIDCPTDSPHRTSFGRSIRDSHYAGPVSWETVLVRSLNSGMAIVAERVSRRDLREAVARFGFGSRTDCGLPGESPGIMQSPRDWSKYTQTSVCMGHEIAVTPLQMVRAFSVFARDGTMPTPRLLARRGDAYDFVHRVLPEDIALETRHVLRRVMTDGTGQRCQSTRYRMFGKSGTPQLPKKEGGGYHERRYMPNFIAAAPFDDPRIVVLCVIDDPDRAIGHWGGTVAGPVVRDVIDESLAYLGVEPDKVE